MENLKSCPFCGGEARLREFRTFNEEYHGIMPKYYVACCSCGAEGPRNRWEQDDAVAEWNQRAGEKPEEVV